MGNYHAPFGKRTMEKGLRQQVPRQRPTSLDGRELETERLGHGHRSGTTRRETAGTKASGPTADHRHRASSRPYRLALSEISGRANYQFERS